MSNHDQLEQRLRTAKGSFDGVAVAPDAWQENQRRIAADRSRRNRWVLGAVAAGLALVLAGGAALLATHGVDPGPPATSGADDDSWAPENLLGPPATLEQIVVKGQRVDHQGVLTDTTGDGPELCTQVVAERYGFGSCTAREPSADKPGVAVDWLLPVEGDGDLRGVVAGLDRRVGLVNLHMSDGTKVPTALKPTGWEGTTMFAYTVPADGPRPQRLVAYARDGRVLQAVDLPARFGGAWLRERSACAGDPVVTFPRPDGLAVVGDASIALGTRDAYVTVNVADGTRETCLEQLRSGAIAGWFNAGEVLVVVLSAEIARAEVVIPEGVLKEAAGNVGGTPWGVMIAKRSPDQLERGEIVVYDDQGQVLDREFVDQPVSP